MSREAWQFFQSHATIIDITVILLGSLLIAIQLVMRLSSSGKRFWARADADLLNIHRAEIQLGIVSTLIEILPYLGILGTVWGLMQGLFVIQNQADPTIKAIAAKLAPALSSTFLGLLFAVVNLFIYNFLAAYFRELIEAYKLDYEQRTTPEAAKVDFEGAVARRVTGREPQR